MKNILAYIINLIFGANTTEILPIKEVEALKLITILNVNYLRAHINTSNALMNSYPSRSLKRKAMTKSIAKMQKQLSEQVYDLEVYRRILNRTQRYPAAASE